MQRIFSGIRPSGKLHLGNYLGAVKNWIELQSKPDTELAVFGVMDYHGITTPFDLKTYHKQVVETAAGYMAAGLKPDGKKILLIRQSHVPQHTELAWIFNTITPLDWLLRLPTLREKMEQLNISNDETIKKRVARRLGRSSDYPMAFHSNEEIKIFIEETLKLPTVNTGLVAYPILMAADILAYKSNLAPVGADQMAHIDITNEIAKKFNSMFGKMFEPVKVPHMGGARIMSLQDPIKKMSKTLSAGSGQASDSYIALSDGPDVVREKIKKATTDSGKEIKYSTEDKPAISNLLSIYGLISSKNIFELEQQYVDKSYVEFKNDLAEVVVDFLKPFQDEYKELSGDMSRVEKILTESEENAKIIASSTLTEVKQKMGL